MASLFTSLMVAKDHREHGGRSSQAFLSGALCGTLSAFLLQPFDVVKTTQQASLVGGSLEYRKLGGFRTAMRIVREPQGVRGLWKGLMPSLYRVFFGAGLYFVSLEHSRDILKRVRVVVGRESDAGNRVDTFVSGAAARCFAAAVMSPVSVVKTRFENTLASTAQRSTTAQALRGIFVHEGPRALFAGLGATLVRDAPFSGLYLVLFELLLEQSKDLDSVPESLKRFTSGIVAGAVATSLTHPADVLKTRQQIRFRTLGVPPLSMAATFVHIVKHDGARAVFRGLGARAAKRSISAALTWTLFLELKTRLL